MKPEKFFNHRTYALMSLLAGQEGNARASAKDKAAEYSKYAVSVFSQQLGTKLAHSLADLLVRFSTKVVELHNANKTNPDFKLEADDPRIAVYFPNGTLAPQLFLVSMLQYFYMQMYSYNPRTAYNGVGFVATRSKNDLKNPAFNQLTSFFCKLIYDNKPLPLPLHHIWMESPLLENLDDLIKLKSAESESGSVEKKESELGVNSYDRLATYPTFNSFLHLTPLDMLYVYEDMFGHNDPNYSEISELYTEVVESKSKNIESFNSMFEKYAETIYACVRSFYKVEPFKYEGKLLENFTQPMLGLLDRFYDLGLMSPSSISSVLGQNIYYKTGESTFVVLELDLVFEGRPHYFRIWAGMNADGNVVHYVTDSYESGIAQNVFLREGVQHISALCEVTDPNTLIRTVLRLIRNTALVRGKIESILLSNQSNETETDMVKLLKVLFEQNLLRKKVVEMQMFY